MDSIVMPTEVEPALRQTLNSSSEQLERVSTTVVPGVRLEPRSVGWAHRIGSPALPGARRFRVLMMATDWSPG